MSPQRSLRVGVIGAGGMGSFHVATLNALAGVDVAVIADPVVTNAERAAMACGAEVSDSPLIVASDPSLDGVVIASPDHTHAELALAAMNAGTRVLCEKPLATSIADAQAIVDWEVAHGSRVLQVGFMREYDLPHRQLADATAGRGQPLLIRCVHRNTNADGRTDELVLGQSVVHDLHSIRFLTGDEIVAVTTHGTRRPSGGLAHVVVVCELANGGFGLVEFDDNGYAYEVSVDVTVAGAHLSTAGPVRPTIRDDASVRIDVGRDWFGWFADAYRIEDAAWTESISATSAIGPSAWDGLVAQAVVEASVASLNGAGRVEVSLPARPALYDE